MLNKIKNVLLTCTIISTFVLGLFKYNDHNEIARLNNNLSATTKQWQDEKGRHVTEVSELRVTNKELTKAYKKDYFQLSGEYEAQLKEVANELSDLNIKLRNAESYNSVDLSVSNDSLVTTIVYDRDSVLNSIKPIKTDHLEINFKVKGDTLIVSHKYSAKIITGVSREVDMYTDNGKRRFFIARWVNPRWQYSAKNVVDDIDANIVSAVHINFQRNKGKR